MGRVLSNMHNTEWGHGASFMESNIYLFENRFEVFEKLYLKSQFRSFSNFIGGALILFVISYIINDT